MTFCSSAERRYREWARRVDSVAEARKLLRSLPPSLAQDTKDGWLKVGRLLHAVGHASASSPSLTTDLERDWIEWSLKGREKLPLPGTITITPGSSVLKSSADLTPHLKRGDRVNLLLTKEESDAMGLKRGCIFRVAYTGALTPTHITLDSKHFAPLKGKGSVKVTMTTAELIMACTREECELEWKAMYVRCEGEAGSGHRGLGNAEDAQRLDTAWRFIQSERRRARELESSGVASNGGDGKSSSPPEYLGMAKKARNNAATVEKQFREMCYREEVFFVEPNAVGRLVRSKVGVLEPPTSHVTGGLDGLKASSSSWQNPVNPDYGTVPSEDKVAEEDAVEASIQVGDHILPLAPGGSCNRRWLIVLKIDAYFGRLRCRPVATSGANGNDVHSAGRLDNDDDGNATDDDNLDSVVGSAVRRTRFSGHSGGLDKSFWIYFERLNGALISRIGSPRRHGDDDDDEGTIASRGVGGWLGPLSGATRTYFRLPFEDHSAAMASLRNLSRKVTADASSAKIERRLQKAVKRFATTVKNQAQRRHENRAIAIAVLRRLQPHRAADFALWSEVGRLLRQATEVLPGAKDAIVEHISKAKAEPAFRQHSTALKIMEKAASLREEQAHEGMEDGDACKCYPFLPALPLLLCFIFICI